MKASGNEAEISSTGRGRSEGVSLRIGGRKPPLLGEGDSSGKSRSF
jgi:hypothetical protein